MLAATGLALVAAVVVLAMVLANALDLPALIAGMAARAVCSGVHLGHRDLDAVIREDVRPAHPLLRWVDISAEADRVTARLPWASPRTAHYLAPFGCVLEPTAALVAAATSLAVTPASTQGPAAATLTTPTLTTPTLAAALPRAPVNAQPPFADGLSPPAALSPAVQAALDDAVASGFAARAGGLEPNTRAIVILVDGRIVAERYRAGLGPDTPQAGWSMAKTVTAVLVHQRLADQGRDATTTRALDWARPARRPDWLTAWADDDRAGLTLAELLTMRDRLDHRETYRPWSDVPRMLWLEADVGRFAGTARRSSETPPFRYASAVSNVIQALLRASFDDDVEYWRFARQRLFAPLGAPGARFETDATGTAIGSSFLWATPREWAALAELLRSDGRLPDGRQLIAPGWLAQALPPASMPAPPPSMRPTPASSTSEPSTSEPSTSEPSAAEPSAGDGYGPHIWRIGIPGTLPCPSGEVLPRDALAMLGHWGQIASILPSRRAVIVRLGWAAPEAAFDRCAFIAAIDRALAAITRAPAATASTSIRPASGRREASPAHRRSRHGTHPGSAADSR